MLTSLLTAAVLPTVLSLTPQAFTPEALWQAWPRERFVTTPAPCLRPAELETQLETLAAKHPEQLQLEQVGQSFLGRPIHLMTLGKGPSRVMLWSQMHGDEPSATPALLDLADYLLNHSQEPVPKTILEQTTLLMIPMLNPDGSEEYQRRNAQDIDINRDALNLTTPEGRLLKRLRDQYQPMLGFNLHDQNRRTAVGGSGKLATNAVLAVAGDERGTLTPGRARAQRACAGIIKALAPLMPGGMARYDEDWSPRAFGDNLTAWGTPVVLIESGGLPPGHPMTDLTRLNFVALLTSLQDLVTNDFRDHDPKLYEALPRNQSDSWVDVAVRGGDLLQPGTTTPYRADLVFNRAQDDRVDAGCPVPAVTGSRIMEIGDSRFLGSGHELDARGRLLTTPWTVTVKGWRARHWLTESALARLARLGVGTVEWQLPPRRQGLAAGFAKRWRSPGRSLLKIVDRDSTNSSQPSLRLKSLPPEPSAWTLQGVLEALSNHETPTDSSLAGWAPLLWPDATPYRGSATLGTNPHAPVLRRGRPASFLLLSPPPDGGNDFAQSLLEAVWLDGVEIRRNAPPRARETVPRKP